MWLNLVRPGGLVERVDSLLRELQQVKKKKEVELPFSCSV